MSYTVKLKKGEAGKARTGLGTEIVDDKTGDAINSVYSVSVEITPDDIMVAVIRVPVSRIIEE